MALPVGLHVPGAGNQMEGKVPWLRVPRHYFPLEVLSCDQAWIIRCQAMGIRCCIYPSVEPLTLSPMIRKNTWLYHTQSHDTRDHFWRFQGHSCGAPSGNKGCPTPLQAHGSRALLLSVSHPRNADLGPTAMESFILPTFPHTSQFVSETKGLLGLKVASSGEWGSKRQGG